MKVQSTTPIEGLDIIELLASTDSGMTQVEISKMLHRKTSEIFRMPVIFRQRDYIEIGENDRYQLTSKMFELAHRHPPVWRLTSIASDAMQKLANQIN